MRTDPILPKIEDNTKSNYPTSDSGSGAIDAENQETTDAEPNGERQVRGIRWAILVCAILSSDFLFALDNTIVADLQPAIVLEFDDIQKLPWLTAAFFLGSLATLIIWGRLYSLFEAKTLYLICMLIFEVGSALCGAAPSMNAMIVGRAIAGVGGAGVYIGVMTLLSVSTTTKERPMYISSTGLVWGVGTVLGPIVGGAFTDSSAGWRWAFYINLCIGGLFLPVYLFMLPKYEPRPNETFWNRAQELDYTGIIFSVGAFLSGLMAISFGGILYDWNSWQIILCFVISGALFILLGIQQGLSIFTTRKFRLYPVHFFGNRPIVLLVAATTAVGGAITIPLYEIPIFFQFTQGDRALQAGVRILPFIALMVVGCLASGVLVSKFGYYMPIYLAGGILVTFGAAPLYALMDIQMTASEVYGFTTLIGLGAGLCMQMAFSLVQVFVEAEEIPQAIGLISVAQAGGMAVSISIANAVFLNDAQKQLVALLPDMPVDQIRAAITGVASNVVRQLPDTLKIKVLEAIISGLSKAMILPIVSGAIMIAVSVLMKKERLHLSAVVGGGA